MGTAGFIGDMWFFNNVRSAKWRAFVALLLVGLFGMWAITGSISLGVTLALWTLLYWKLATPASVAKASPRAESLHGDHA
jgi:hypothetical protein